MEKIECKTCSKIFENESSLQQHIKAKHEVSDGEKTDILRKKIRKRIIAGLIIATILLFAYAFYVRAQKPGEYEDFAKCLNEKGVVMYGNDFCQYTIKQLNLFGKSKEHLNYVKCVNNEELCNSKSISKTPTWEIDGKYYPEVRDIGELSELSGCNI